MAQGYYQIYKKATINWLFVAAQGGGLGKCYPMTATINLLKEGKIDRNGNNQPILVQWSNALLDAAVEHFIRRHYCLHFLMKYHAC